MLICSDYENYDCHTHTYYSFDALKNPSSPEQMVAAAVGRGFSGIILTDHLEINSEVEGIYEKFSIDARQKECCEAKEKYKGIIDVKIGIELGQPTQYPDVAREYLQKYRFEFIIGSLHNIRGKADFAEIDYTGYTEAQYIELWDRYLNELYELTNFPGIECFAHLTYPLRYFEKYGYKLDTSKWSAQISLILKSVIAHDLYLEVNSSGYRRGMGCPLPDAHILKLYKMLGGSKICFSSDAHFPCDVGADFDKTLALVEEI